MKTYLSFGFACTLGGALLLLVLYFLGLHSDPEKLGTAQWIGGLGGAAIAATCITLGIKARRAEIPPTEDFGYGRALGTGVMIALFAALFGLVTNYLYFNVVNPGFNDVTVQAQIAKWEAAGRSATQIEQGEKGMRMFMKPAIQAAFGFIFGFVFNVVISLIAAAFLKRPAVEEMPSAN